MTAPSKKTPFPHQAEGSEWLATKPVRYLGWGPRCGKTLTATLGAKVVGAQRILILCPVGVIPVWGAEMLAEGFDVGMFKGTERKKAIALTKPVLVINYESVWRRNINPGHYDLVILDEAHKLSSLRAKQTLHFVHMPKASRCWLLSGTPMIESELQMAGQMFAAQGSFMGNLNPNTYVWENWSWDEYRHKMVPNDPSHPREIKRRFEGWASVKDAESLGLPPKLYEMIEVEPNFKDLAAIESNTQQKGCMPLEPTVIAMRTQQAVGGWDEEKMEMHRSAKFDELEDLVKELVELNESVLITCRFVEEVKYIALELGCMKIHGDTSPTQRENARVAFAEGHIRVIVAQVQTIKLGMDFSKANTHIFYSNDWSGEARTQAEDRTRNITKSMPSRIIDLVSGETDKAVAEAVRGKLDYNTRLLAKGASR